MAATGLMDRFVEAVAICSREYAELRTYGLNLPAECRVDQRLLAFGLHGSGRASLMHTAPPEIPRSS